MVFWAALGLKMSSSRKRMDWGVLSITFCHKVCKFQWSMQPCAGMQSLIHTMVCLGPWFWSLVIWSSWNLQGSSVSWFCDAITAYLTVTGNTSIWTPSCLGLDLPDVDWSCKKKNMTAWRCAIVCLLAQELGTYAKNPTCKSSRNELVSEILSCRGKRILCLNLEHFQCRNHRGFYRH